MPFHVCYYHIVWATKNRQPWTIASMEQTFLERIKQKSQALKSPIVCVNAWRDHVHIAVQIHPTISVSDWVRHVKGFSSFQINQLYPDQPMPFRWQDSYGVMTFGTKQLPFIVSYIEQQKQHHEGQTTYTYLEKIDDDNSR